MDVIEVGSGRTRVCIRWRRHGRDLHVQIGGGEEHIGAVALCGRADDGSISADLVVVPPHKEGPMVAQAARTLHERLGCNVCVTGGVHLDAITPDEIRAVLENAERGISRLAERLSQAGRGN